MNADGATTSNEATATPVAGLPAKPTGLTTEVFDCGDGCWTRVLEWDRAADASVLRYEFSADDGRTWSLLTSDPTDSSPSLPRNEFLSGYTFRVRAVNALGPGPASEPVVGEWEEEEELEPIPVLSASLEWDATTRKATLVWDQTEHAHLRLWSLYFDRNVHGSSTAKSWDTDLPIGTTRYEIPATFNAGAPIVVSIAGCVRARCVTLHASHRRTQLRFEAGGPNAVPQGL